MSTSTSKPNVSAAWADTPITRMRRILFAGLVLAGVAVVINSEALAQDDASARAIQQIKSLQVWYRDSVFGDGTKVLVLKNPSLTAIRVTLQCFTIEGDSRTFQLVVPPKDTAELGSMQGWPNNFTPGEWCQSVFDGQPIWYAKAR